MSMDAVFTMKLEPELREEFMAEAAAEHRPASQVVRELMREYVRHQQDAREYEAFLAEKVQASRSSFSAGDGVSGDRVEEEFARRRTAAQ
ncbi:antitoxin of toxin-antitoxin stability system [Acidipropionibacterium virtanenii]|uniref:Antitoxin of toxin-antitoxin stability system n=1 Tax=Acidipropionibacterium virtanenii TaxID=2057246 RepID=A0A344UPQ2_9ACTN|nr:antitoxin of toxin-antitoxin stability system [Acidipropionibacterium virtanenii]AXE37250.1 hypothetical protein JS278_00052 [Acidipropionibacterium virtanenii]